MIFLLPIGHEKDTVRRLPFVTFSILAICFIIHIFVSFQVRDASTQVEERAKELINYYISHPYLEFDPETKKLLFGGFEDEKIDTLLSIYSQSDSSAAPDGLLGMTVSLAVWPQGFGIAK